MNDPRNDPLSGYRPDLDKYPEPEEPPERWVPGWWIIPVCVLGAVGWFYIVKWIFGK